MSLSMQDLGCPEVAMVEAEQQTQNKENKLYICVYTHILEERLPLETFSLNFGALTPLADTLEALAASFWYVLAPSGAGDHFTCFEILAPGWPRIEASMAK